MHRLGHAPNEKVSTQRFLDPGCNRFVDLIAQMEVLKMRDQRFAFRGQQELLERHRMEEQVLNAAHGHGVLELTQSEVQQRPGGNHMKLRNDLVKVSEHGQSLGAGLDFIQEQEAFPRNQALALE